MVTDLDHAQGAVSQFVGRTRLRQSVCWDKNQENTKNSSSSIWKSNLNSGNSETFHLDSGGLALLKVSLVKNKTWCKCGEIVRNPDLYWEGGGKTWEDAHYSTKFYHLSHELQLTSKKWNFNFTKQLQSNCQLGLKTFPEEGATATLIFHGSLCKYGHL